MKVAAAAKFIEAYERLGELLDPILESDLEYKPFERVSREPVKHWHRDRVKHRFCSKNHIPRVISKNYTPSKTWDEEERHRILSQNCQLYEKFIYYIYFDEEGAGSARRTKGQGWPTFVDTSLLLPIFNSLRRKIFHFYR